MRTNDLEALYAYRYSVFVERLRWELPMARPGCEADEFDRPDTIHVLARDDSGYLCGCSRLLPTTSPYLLESIFPELMGGCEPHSPDTWEVSRFTTLPIAPPDSAIAACGRQAEYWICKELMAATIIAARGVGAQKLVGVSVLAIERILIRLGIHAYRVGPAMRLHGHNVFAFCIEIDEQTLEALQIDHEFAT